MEENEEWDRRYALIKKYNPEIIGVFFKKRTGGTGFEYFNPYNWLYEDNLKDIIDAWYGTRDIVGCIFYESFESTEFNLAFGEIFQE